MTQSTSAAIHIEGPTIRYATVLRNGDTWALRRVGQEGVEFDVTRALWDGDDASEALGRAGTTLREAVGEEEPSSVRIVVHPLDVYSFFAPIPAGLSEGERRRHATRQAALVTGIRAPDTLRLSLQTVRVVEAEGESIEWVHVLALPRAVAERMDALGDALPGDDGGRVVSTAAAARLLGHADEGDGNADENDEQYALTIGAYASHTEYSLTHDRSWYHAHAAEEARTPANRAFYAAGFLNRTEVPPSAVERLFVYGPEADSALEETFETIFECSSRALDPFEILDPAPAFVPEEPVSTYVPCVGGALAGAA